MSGTERLGTGQAFNHMTILDGGSGQHAGKLGEIAFAKWLIVNDVEFSWHACDKGPVDFSLSLSGRYAGVDVKTKERNVPADWNHDAHVTAEQERHACQIYVFCNVTDGETTLMGWCGKLEFWQKCRRVKKGSKEGPFVERADAGKLPYRELKKMEHLLRYR